MSNPAPYTPPQGYHLEPDVATKNPIDAGNTVTLPYYSRVADTPPPPVSSAPSVWHMLTHSRKALIVTVDTVGAIVILAATHYLSPSDADFVLKCVGLLQLPIITWIGAITVEDKARLDNGLRA